MSDIQAEIDKMHNGSIESIMKGISSDIPIVILNAIIAGTRLELKNIVFTEGINKTKRSAEVLLGVPIRNFAIASLDVLGIEKYLGDDIRIKELIDCKFRF